MKNFLKGYLCEPNMFGIIEKKEDKKVILMWFSLVFLSLFSLLCLAFPVYGDDWITNISVSKAGKSKRIHCTAGFSGH